MSKCNDCKKCIKKRAVEFLESEHQRILDSNEKRRDKGGTDNKQKSQMVK